MKNLYILLVSVFFLNTAQAHFGPRGLFGGNVTCGTHFNGNVFFGTEEGGVYMSANVQLTGWRVRNVGLKSGLTADLYHNGSHIFVATKDEGVFIFNGSAGGNDLFWNESNNGLSNKQATALGGVFNTQRLYVGTQSGLFESSNEGATWSAVNNAFFNNQHITAIEELDGRIVVATNNGGLYATDDYVNWTNFNDANTSVTGTISLSYNASTDELMVINSNGLFLLDNASTTSNPVYVAAAQGASNTAVLRNVSNNGANWYLATNEGVWSTSSQTIAWSAINAGLTQLNTHVVVALQDDILVGTQEAGVFRSSTANYDWNPSNTGIHGITNIRVFSVAGLGDTITATATERGVAISFESGFNPVVRNNGLVDSLHVNDLAFAGEDLVAATNNNGIFMTDDFGLNWQAINQGLPTQNISKVFYANDALYAIGDNGKIYQTALGTINWSEYMTGIPSNLNVTSMAFYANWLYAGTFGGGVYAKKLGDNSWQEFNSCPCGSYSIGNLNVTSLAVSAGRLYAGTHGSGVYSCQYDYSNWVAASPIQIAHFDDVPFLQPQFIQAMSTFGGFVMASFKGGVVATKDGGATWVRAGHQFHIPSYSDINKISFITSRIMITTEQNNMLSNSINEFNNIDDTLHVASIFQNMSAAGGMTYHSVTTNMEWEVTNVSDSWIQVGNDEGFRNGVIDVLVDENTSADSRTATITVSAGTFSEVITINQQGALGLSEEALAKAVKLYPNPTDGNFTIDANQEIKSISVINLLGQTNYFIDNVFSENITVQEQLETGAYLVHIAFENYSVTKRLIIH
jgi:photosystem II stability/assembly factor-like uncharacterized protein